MLEQKLTGFWWTKKISTIIYFVRELTGVVIAFYLLYFLIETEIVGAMPAELRTMLHFRIATSIALAASLFHTVTWLWVTTKVTPKPLPVFAQLILFIALILIWLAIWYLAFFYVYFDIPPGPWTD